MLSLKLIEDATFTTDVVETKDGYLTAKVRCARSGIQEYAGSDVGLPNLPIARVYRPESEVFDSESMLSYAGRPATDDHPDDLVDSKNWRNLSVGGLGQQVIREGEYVVAPLMISDEAAVVKVKGGKRGLSMGYLVDIKHESGTTDKGEQYDAVQTKLRMNHIAIVDEGRAGPRVRIGDSWSAANKPAATPTQQPTTTEKLPMSAILKTKVVDGLSVETNDAGATAIDKLLAERTAAQEALTAANTENQKAVNDAKATHDQAVTDLKTAHTKEVAKKDSEIADLKKQIVSDEELDSLVASRAAFNAKAKAILGDVDLTGKSPADVQKMAIEKVRGAGFTKDRDEVYLQAAFDLLETKPSDQFADALFNQAPSGGFTQQPAQGGTPPHQMNDNGHSSYVARISGGRGYVAPKQGAN